MSDPPGDFAYDCFISYSHRDEEWVAGWLVPELRRRGAHVCIDREAFELGEPTVTAIENAILTSRKTVLVLTPAYLASEWCDFESILLQTLDPAARQRRLLPLVLEPCELPLRFQLFTYLDMTVESSQATNLARLVRAVQAKPPEGPRP